MNEQLEKAKANMTIARDTNRSVDLYPAQCDAVLAEIQRLETHLAEIERMARREVPAAAPPRSADIMALAMFAGDLAHLLDSRTLGYIEICLANAEGWREIARKVWEKNAP